MTRCAATNPHDEHMQCVGQEGHDGPHHLGGIAWWDEDVPTRRISLGLTRGGEMQVSMPGKPGEPVDERTIEALRAIGEAALDRMEREWPG